MYFPIIMGEKNIHDLKKTYDFSEKCYLPKNIFLKTPVKSLKQMC